MAERYFTLKEANELVPWLAEVFDSIEPLQTRADELTKEVTALRQRVRTNGGSNVEDEARKRRSAIREPARAIEARMTEVHERGIIVRSIPQGLVDFPHLREGREVYLCWIRGETEIGFWHETDTGYASRQSL